MSTVDCLLRGWAAARFQGLALLRGGLFGLGGLGGGGGRAGGLGFSAGGGGGGGGGFAWEVLRGLPGPGGLNPQLDSRISLSAHPSHPNLPRLAQHGVFAAQVSVRRRDCSHSRNPDRIEHPRCGFEEQQLVQGGQGDAELGGAQPIADPDPRDVCRVHFHLMTGDTSVHKMR